MKKRNINAEGTVYFIDYGLESMGDTWTMEDPIIKIFNQTEDSLSFSVKKDDDQIVSFTLESNNNISFNYLEDGTKILIAMKNNQYSYEKVNSKTLS